MSNAGLTCTECHRSFSRREHLERHSRIHSNEKPFPCSVCGKRYARQDVYQKHLRCHEFRVSLPRTRRKNAPVACEACRARKLKCHDTQRPCPRCTSSGVACVFREDRRSTVDRASSLPSPHESATQFTGLSADMSGTSVAEVVSEITSGQQSDEPPPTVDPSLTIANPRNDLANHNFSHFDSLLNDPYLMLFDEANFDIFQGQETFFDDLATRLAPGVLPASSERKLEPLLIVYKVYGPTAIDPGLDMWASPMDLQVTPPDNVAGSNNEEQKQRISAAYAKLNEYSSVWYPSRPGSPTSANSQQRYLQQLGNTDPLTYDALIIDIFVGLFQIHVAPTFPCFRNFRLDVTTPEEVYLPMAAVGGLYCTTPKSDVVVRWLHHLARRRLFTVVYSNYFIHQRRKISIVKCYILMEIFGFMCGDKRFVFLLDVFHSQMLQVAGAYLSTLTEAEQASDEVQGLIDAIDLLECYRVVLLQRSTMLYSVSLMGRVPYTSQNASGTYHQTSLLSVLHQLTSVDACSVKIDNPRVSMQVLCALSVMFSNTQRLPGSRSRSYMLKKQRVPTVPRGGRWQEFVEVAMQRWLTSHVVPITPDVLILYHAIHLSMYADFAEIERCARQHLKTRDVSISECSVNTTAQLFRSGRGDITQANCFVTDGSKSKASWHAIKVLDIAEEMKPCQFSQGQLGQRIHLAKLAGSNESTTQGEATHCSHAVYYACMVLWCSMTLDKEGPSRSRYRSRSRDRTGMLQSSNADMELREILRRGTMLLSRSASPVAAVLRQTLTSLQEL